MSSPKKFGTPSLFKLRWCKIFDLQCSYQAKSTVGKLTSEKRRRTILQGHGSRRLADLFRGARREIAPYHPIAAASAGPLDAARARSLPDRERAPAQRKDTFPPRPGTHREGAGGGASRATRASGAPPRHSHSG